MVGFLIAHIAILMYWMVEISWESCVEIQKQCFLCLTLFADDIPIEDIIFISIGGHIF